MGGDAGVIEGYVIEVELVVPLPKEYIIGLGDDICGQTVKVVPLEIPIHLTLSD